MSGKAQIAELGQHEGQRVEVQGWLYNRRSSGRIQFLIIRDGSGVVQAVATAERLGTEAMEQLSGLTQETSLTVSGLVQADARAPGGYELLSEDIKVVSPAAEYPLSLKEHGVDFLLDHRHLWLRTPRQVAIMRVRHAVIRGMEDYLIGRGFVRLDTPILTPVACEGTSNLFETSYFGQKAYLAQSGQLYAEAGAMALGRVYCFGPTFRAEKSKTRKHLLEFWMLEPEMAYADHEDNMRVQEQLVSHTVAFVLEQCRHELQGVLERDVSVLERIRPPFPRITYDSALELARADGIELEWGDDLGAPAEAALSARFELPVMVERYPVACKSFYMEPDPARPEVALCDDMLAPEGYGEIVGGSQRIHDLELLEQRIHQHGLPAEAFQWYMDLRRYGSVPHSGFGIGIERTVAWICGVDHIRECIPFPRMLNRMYP